MLGFDIDKLEMLTKKFLLLFYITIEYCDMSTSCWVARQGLRSGALLGSRPLNNSRPNTTLRGGAGSGIFSAQPR
jgi:hypothetical protein